MQVVSIEKMEPDLCPYSVPSSAGYKINNAQAGLLTCPDYTAFPSDRRTVAIDCCNYGSFDDWTKRPTFSMRNSQQRELLPIFTVFPFNSTQA